MSKRSGLGVMPSIAAVLLTCACSLQRERITVDGISRETGLAFSKEAKVTHFTETPPMDPTWVARVTMPKAFEGDFVSILRTKRADTGTVHGALSESTIWWKPKKVTLDQHYLVEGASIHVVLSDEGGQLVAYIERAVF